MRCDAINIPLYNRLRININLFAVQQSIDHIQMPTPWSPHQRVLSILHFFSSTFKKNTSKYEAENLEMECDNSIIQLTWFCQLTSISSQSNNRLTTSKCAFREDHISAVRPVYIFLSSAKFYKKTLNNYERWNWRGM